jgi:hypothetical protein
MTPEVALAYFALSVVAGVVGRNRRIGFWGFVFCSIIFTPVVSLLFLYFSTPRMVDASAKPTGATPVKASRGS